MRRQTANKESGGTTGVTMYAEKDVSFDDNSEENTISSKTPAQQQQIVRCQQQDPLQHVARPSTNVNTCQRLS